MARRGEKQLALAGGRGAMAANGKPVESVWGFPRPPHVHTELLQPSQRTTFCEWKGGATYADVVTDRDATAEACWTYADPSSRFAEITSYWAFYARLMDECWVDDERVDGNEGGFYGGWITGNVTGPFKDGAGTMFW